VLTLEQPARSKDRVRALRFRNERSQTFLGNDRILMVADDVLERPRSLREPTRSLAARKLGCVARSLAALAYLVQGLV